MDGTPCCRGAELQGFAFVGLEFSVTWKQVALLGRTLEFEKAPSGTGLVTFLRALFERCVVVSSAGSVAGWGWLCCFQTCLGSWLKPGLGEPW